MHRRLLLSVLLSLLVASPAAFAVSFGFQNITANSVADAAIGEAQLSVDVTDAGGGLVSFLFGNSGPLASSITDVYFDDGTLLAIASVNNGAGVDFSQNANPPDLPGANNASPPFNATTGFSADSNPPTQPNGVNPLETLEILFSLQSAQSFADTIAALNSGSLRIGIHVQGFASEGSESFTTTPVPEPSAALLFVTGVVLVGTRLRRSARA